MSMCRYCSYSQWDWLGRLTASLLLISTLALLMLQLRVAGKDWEDRRRYHRLNLRLRLPNHRLLLVHCLPLTSAPEERNSPAAALVESLVGKEDHLVEMRADPAMLMLMAAEEMAMRELGPQLACLRILGCCLDEIFHLVPLSQE